MNRLLTTMDRVNMNEESILSPDEVQALYKKYNVTT
jgi:hypothetical protein